MPETRWALTQLELENASTTNKIIRKKHRNIDQLEDVAADSSFADDILHNYQILDNVNVHLWRFKKTFAEE